MVGADEARRLVTDRAVLAPRIEAYAQTVLISPSPPIGPASMSMPKEMGSKPVAMIESRVALDLVRSIVLTNSSRICSGVKDMVGG